MPAAMQMSGNAYFDACRKELLARHKATGEAGIHGATAALVAEIRQAEAKVEMLTKGRSCA